MAIIGIIAIAKNFAIGRDGKLPWHYSADLKFFKQTTLNNAVVMGRKTFESIGKILPDRLNIILSRSKNFESESGLINLTDQTEVFSLANYLKGDIFIIGGASIYKTFSDDITKWIVTEIPVTVEDADVFMPSNFLSNFTVKQQIELDENLKVKFYEKNSL